MRLLSGLVGEIGAVINTLSISFREKKRTEVELIAAVSRQEEALSQSQAAIIQAEAGGKLSLDKNPAKNCVSRENTIILHLM